ncbi:MAG: hypothetical protein AAF791_09200 [Bacteroidota bacterium]
MPIPTALADPTLATCDRGTVRLCRCCGHVALWFNGVSLTMTREEMDRMRGTLSAVRGTMEEPGAVWGWSLRAETARKTVTFDLWGDDAEVLSSLLHHAASVLELDALLLATLGPRPAV